LLRKSHTYKTLNRKVGKAVHQYEMIADGDRILVGLSGGKDSLTLLRILQERRARIPIRYRLFPVYVDPGFDGGFGSRLKAYGRDAGTDIRIEYTDFGSVAHSEQNRENPCFLCAWLRRKRLFEIADELGCKKVALGHHKDDIIETLFMNMCYAGEISTMVPAQPFFKGRFTVIRPLAFAEESTIRRYAEENALPMFVNPCPSAENSKRYEIKKLLAQLYRTNRKIKGNIFRAMGHVKLDYLLKHRASRV
jgi:tRNA 2-thiocytidine biosynthesis protein TtcA